MPKRTRKQFEEDSKQVSIDEALNNRLTEESKKQYVRYVDHMKAFFEQKEWACLNGRVDVTEDRLLEYFQYEALACYCPSTCWSIYSAIKSWLMIDHKLGQHFPRLQTLLKAANKGYRAWRKMPNHDPNLLVQKVASMLFWFGALRAVGDGKPLTCDMIFFQPHRNRIKVLIF
jgi:hypothetical protein